VDGRVKPGHDELNLSIEQKCAGRDYDKIDARIV